jgi:heptosyltransferase-2
MNRRHQPQSPGRFLKERWLGWVEPLLACTPADPRVVASMSAERILVVRQHDQLGDFLLAIPALRALRARYPDAWIAVVVRRYFAEAARMIPFVDEVLVVEENFALWTWRSFAAFWRALRNPWSLAVVLTTVSHSVTSDFLAYFSRARVVVGSAGRVFPGASRNFLYHVAAPVAAGPRHQSERNLDIVRAIGCTTDDLREELRAPAAELREVERALGPQRRIGLHIGAGKLPNRWPAREFARLAALLEEGDGARILLFWGPAESDLKEEFLRHRTGPTELVGHPSVTRLAAYFRACDAVVCNDTGVLHLAAAVGVPTVALFGPTDPAEWKPVGEHVRALAGEGGIVAAIPVEAVAKEVGALLRAFPPRDRA